MILAAIDIGTNASRLLISEVVVDKGKQVKYNKLNLVRVPLRLGFDVFDTGYISDAKQRMMIQTLKGYSHLMNAYGVFKYIAVATSAMRDAKNHSKVITDILDETGIDINIISGDNEASLIVESHTPPDLTDTSYYLYLDVGGGSTELTVYAKGTMMYKQSFNIGTIRLLKDVVSRASWDEMKDAIKKNIKEPKEATVIGIGGNINKIFSLSKRKDGKSLSLQYLKEVYEELSVLSVEQRMKTFNLREDRADVIVPALTIIIQVMKWSGIDEILVPKIGLADGLIHHLYAKVST